MGRGPYTPAHDGVLDRPPRSRGLSAVLVRRVRAHQPDGLVTAGGSVTGRIGASSYSNVLTVSLEPEGLRLAVMGLFRPGHPPLRIPWGDLLNVRKSTILFSTFYAFETEQADTVTIRLPERIVEGIIEMAS